MAEKDKPVRDFGRDVPPTSGRTRPDILRIKDIIPGSPGAGESDGTNKVDIPRFDLAQDIMAEQRRLTAVRRKGPSTENKGMRMEAEDRSTSYFIGSVPSTQSYVSLWDPIIADIVARDIDRLCSGARI